MFPSYDKGARQCQPEGARTVEGRAGHGHGHVRARAAAARRLVLHARRPNRLLRAQRSPAGEAAVRAKCTNNTQGSDLDGPAGKGWDEWDHPVACLRIVRFASASMDQVSTWSTIVGLGRDNHLYHTSLTLFHSCASP